MPLYADTTASRNRPTRRHAKAFELRWVQEPVMGVLHCRNRPARRGVPSRVADRPPLRAGKPKRQDVAHAPRTVGKMGNMAGSRDTVFCCFQSSHATVGGRNTDRTTNITTGIKEKKIPMATTAALPPELPPEVSARFKDCWLARRVDSSIADCQPVRAGWFFQRIAPAALSQPRPRWHPVGAHG